MLRPPLQALSRKELEILKGFIAFGASATGLMVFALAGLALFSALLGEMLRA